MHSSFPEKKEEDSVASSSFGLTQAEYSHLLMTLEKRLSQDMHSFAQQHTVYLILQSVALLSFAVVLFLNAQRYHSPVIWGVGVCLLLFSLIAFLELDLRTSGKGIVDKLLPPEGAIILEQEEDHGR
jgi:hypothetical protein